MKLIDAKKRIIKLFHRQLSVPLYNNDQGIYNILSNFTLKIILINIDINEALFIILIYAYYNYII
jgi:hypothetical protein